MKLTKRGKFTVIGGLLVIVILLIGVNVLKAKAHPSASNLAGVPVQGVAAIPDYHLIPVLDTQSKQIHQVYLNTSVTPAFFVATDAGQSPKEIAAIQDELSKINKGIHKPLVLVSTFVKTTDQAKAVAAAKAFVQKNKVTLPITVQVGPPTEFVKQTPSLVYTDAKGTHIVTDQNKILDALKTILVFPQTTSKVSGSKVSGKKK